MSALKDLAAVIPAELLREQARYNAQQRVIKSYAGRIDGLSRIENAFAHGQQARPRKKKVQVRHENSSCGSVITVKRFENSRLTCVCKSKINF